MSLLIVHVSVHVKPGTAQAFIAATQDNARNSRLEPGVIRFDLLQVADDPHKFLLVEIYHSADDIAAHKETAHYKRWRENVDGIMAETRTSVRYSNVDPGDDGWS